MEEPQMSENPTQGFEIDNIIRQLNALLTALMQTHFNRVNFVITRLTSFFIIYIFFYPFIDGQCYIV